MLPAECVLNEQLPKAVVEIDADRCKACELCVVICPHGCLRLNRSVYNANGFHPAVFSHQGPKGRCSACGLCYLVCPDYAVTKIMLRRSEGPRHEG